MNKQVDKEHYRFESYCYPERWESYYHQLREVDRLNPKNILEIGIGDNVFGNYVSKQLHIPYTSMDVAQDLAPDVVGSIDNIPLKDSAFDVVCAFEVLEHLPFDAFEQSIRELNRVAKRYVVISLPHFGPPIKICFKIPFLREIRVAWKLPFPIRHIFNGEHYWEIGKRGYSQRKIKVLLVKHFDIVREFVPFGSQYHHFYVLKKQTGKKKS